MVLLAGLVLIFLGLPIVLWMASGAIWVLESIWILIRSLCHFIGWLHGLRKRRRVTYHRPERTAAPAANVRALRPKEPKAIDPQLRNVKAMATHWRGQGYTVGLINNDTGELFIPAKSDEEDD